jgi:hypothetical protein
VKKIVGKIVLDVISLVSQAYDEFIEAIKGIGFHDVPEDGLFSDFNHGFRLDPGFFRKAGAEPAG